jgi:hypothetical protein
MLTASISRKSQENPADSVSGVTPKAEENKGDNNFEAFLKGLFKGNNVSEEELFAGVMQQRVNSLKGDGTGEEFKTIVANSKSSMSSWEDAAKSALNQFMESGKISREEGNSIYSESFSAAQLDDKADALFDDKGGAGDPTIAIAAVDQAISQAKAKIGSLTDGKAAATARDISEANTGYQYKNGSASSASTSSFLEVQKLSATDSGILGNALKPQGRKFDGSGGFLYKPVSDNEGKLAIILPEEFTNEINQLLLRDKDGKKIEEGRFTSNGDYGKQAKYVFSKQGGGYPDDLTVEVTTKDGKTTSWHIPDASARFD